MIWNMMEGEWSNFEEVNPIFKSLAMPTYHVLGNHDFAVPNETKADVFKRIIWYSYVDDYSSMLAIPLDQVKVLMDMNKNGKKPEKLEDFAVTMEQKTEYSNGIDQEELNRFDEEFK